MVLLITLISAHSSSATPIEFRSWDAEKVNDTFIISGYAIIYAELPVNRSDIAKIYIELMSDVEGTAGLRFLTDYDVKIGDIKKGFNEIEYKLYPHSDEKVYILLILSGEGNLTIKRAELELQEPDFLYRGDEYDLVIVKKDWKDTILSGDTVSLKLYSLPKKPGKLNFSAEVFFFDNRVYERDYDLTLAERVRSVEIKPSCFKFPGFYKVRIYSEEWEFVSMVTVVPGIKDISFMAFISFAIAFVAVLTIKYKITSRFTVGQNFVFIAILLLVFAAITLSIDDEELANVIAIISYYFLVVGVGNLLVEYWLSDKGDNPFSEIRGVVGLMILSLLLHYSPEVVEKLPYSDWTILLASVLLLIYLFVKKSKA
jgi:hypothetical protein